MERAPRKARIGLLKRGINSLSPIPYLAKARDYYVRSFSECAGRANYSGLAAGGLRVSTASPLPKSFRTSSSMNEDNYRERVASQGRNLERSRFALVQKTCPIPNSFGTSSSTIEDEYDEMTSSQKRSSELSWSASVQQPFLTSTSSRWAPSVGRIDEDEPYYFPGSFRKIVSVTNFRCRHGPRLTTDQNRKS